MNKLREMDLVEIDLVTEEKTRFRIDSLDSAIWAFRKLKAIDEQEREIKASAKSEIERIKTWEKSELESTGGSKEYFEGLLTEYYVTNKVKDDKFKLSTPYGKVTSRKQQPKWNYEDEKVIDWLKKNNTELIRVKEEVDKANFKKVYKIHGNKVVTEDGEIIEGVNIEEREPSITIKVED